MGFLALGYLTCVGISALATRVAGYFIWVYVVPAIPQDQLVAVTVNESIGATLAGIVLSIIPVLWLANSWSYGPRSFNSRWSGHAASSSLSVGGNR